MCLAICQAALLGPEPGLRTVLPQLCAAPQPFEPLSGPVWESYQGPALALQGSIAGRRQEGVGLKQLPLRQWVVVVKELPNRLPCWGALTAVPWFLALFCVCVCVGGVRVVGFVVPVATRGIVWKIQVEGHLLRRTHISLQPIMSC